jgi:arsenate reductase
MIVYVYSKCSTCQKALKFLKQKNISFIQKEISEHPPSKEELKKMLQFQKGDLKKLFNTSGKLYRELEIASKISSLSVDEACSLLSQNGMLVKRPFILSESLGCVGFKENEWNQKII